MARVIGREGRMTERAQLGDAQGEWARALDAVNGLVDDLARPTTRSRACLVAVAEGDLTQKMAATSRPAPEGRVRAHRTNGQHDGRPAARLRRRGHPRRA